MLTWPVVFIVALLALMPIPARAQGGPPLMTDDPDTPGPGHWEINIAALVETSRSATRIETPRLDLNYGVGGRIQLKFEMPWAIVRGEEGTFQRGAGSAVAGVKWRFIGQEGKRVAWSTYPQLEFNISHVSARGDITESGRRFLLPTEITIEAFHVEVNGEVGRNFVENGSDSWVFGVSTEGHTTPRMELLAEVHDESASGEPSETFLNGGARYKLTERFTLMIAGGWTAQRLPEEGHRGYLYGGLQLNLPGRYAFKEVAPRARPGDGTRFGSRRLPSP